LSAQFLKLLTKNKKMKKYIAVLVLFIVASCSNGQNKTDHQEIAKRILVLLQKNEYSKVVEYFDSTYATRLTSEKLEKAWKSVINLVGGYVKTNEIRDSSISNFLIVVQRCEFEKKVINLKIVFNLQGKIVNFSVLPDHQVDKYEVPGYYDSTRVEEIEVEVISGEYHLPGTLSVPKTGTKFPVVVFVHGSGANDRDETVNATKMFKDIALGLSTKGVAALRFDKRNKVYEGKSPLLRSIPTVKEETIDDVIAAVKSLKNYSSIDTNRIFLLGHGFGGMLLPRIAKELPNLAGLFMMASNAGNLEDVFYNETVYLLSLDSMTEKKGLYLDSLRKQVETVKHLKSTSINDSTVPDKLVHFPKTYWVDLNNYHQTEVAKGLKLPVYILQGERDYQLPMKDFETWKKELSQKKNVVFKSYPKLNHLFIEGTGKGTPLEYDRKGNVAPYVIDDLVNWIVKRDK